MTSEEIEATKKKKKKKKRESFQANVAGEVISMPERREKTAKPIVGAKEGRCVAAIDRHQYEKRRSPALVSGDIGLGSTGTELSLSFCEAFFAMKRLKD